MLLILLVALFVLYAVVLTAAAAAWSARFFPHRHSGDRLIAARVKVQAPSSRRKRR